MSKNNVETEANDRKMGSKGERKLPTSVVGIANPLPLTAILSHCSANT